MIGCILSILLSGIVFSADVEKTFPASEYVWNWRDAVVLKAMVDVCGEGEDAEAQVWVKTAMDATLEKVHGKHPNGVASGVGLAYLASTPLDKDGVYAAKSQKVYDEYSRIARHEGASSHRPSRVELWDDTVYMLSIFLLQMYETTGESKYLDDCIREIRAHAAKLRDPQTGLWWHGWSVTNTYHEDKCCQYMWNSNNLQRNTEFWGRGNGWIAMSLADALSVMTQEHPDYDELMSYYRRMMDTLVKLQDAGTGHWRQLPLRTADADKGNYIESSCTAMFGYALAKGINSGLLKGRKYRKAAVKAYDGLNRLSVSIDDSISMSNICAGTCIGEKAYYYSRSISDDESFAIGAYLLFDNQINNINH